MHELTNVLVASSVRYWRVELMHLISMYAALHTRSDDVLFHSKIAIKDEAEVADGS